MFLEQIPGKKYLNYEEISRFPVVRRDLSVVIGEEVPIAELLQSVKNVELNLETNSSGEKNYLANLELTDVYQGDPVAAGKKSVTLGLTFQRISDTLVNWQVENMMTQILDSLRKEFDAQLRE